ncbi:MAG: hydroxymethylbilane synthase [Sphingobacteriia bacterium 28-36-52]|nr:MAG: hydroxymethylbilane synthase [Sphingobacteriia bacterium 28-36-52]
MKPIWKIGTRESQLALWQANWVKDLLESQGEKAELVLVKSEGDIDLVTPLYEMGVQGIFTKSLDTALLKESIDIAVHSMKDVPTKLPKGIVQVAVLPRASYKDVFVINHSIDNNPCTELLGREENDFFKKIPITLATSSIRRKAQWLNRFPHHQLESIRGNVNSRLQKVYESKWNGAIFAKAGLERIGILPKDAIELDWMLPAPAQGAVVIVTRVDNQALIQLLKNLNDDHTDLCTKIERDFLRTLLGGCTTPISALAEVKDELVHFSGQLLSVDGAEKIEISIKKPITESENIGRNAGLEVLTNGGASIIQKMNLH